MLIETHELTKRFGNKIAVNKADIQIKRGQLVAYLGTNGAGKSTTINMLTGLVKLTSGIISKVSFSQSRTLICKNKRLCHIRQNLFNLLFGDEHRDKQASRSK